MCKRLFDKCLVVYLLKTFLQMDNQLSVPAEQETRLDRERARKRFKQACESPTKERRKRTNRERNMLCRASESEVQHLEHLTAGQQQEADRRASESEAQCLQCLTAAQRYKVNHRSSESEAKGSQRLAVG